MAKLSKEEQTLMDRLKAKMEAPDAPSVGKMLSATIDLGDSAQVALAKKFGFLNDDDDDDDSSDGKDGDDDDDDGPRRSGYFGKDK